MLFFMYLGVGCNLDELDQENFFTDEPCKIATLLFAMSIAKKKESFNQALVEMRIKRSELEDEETLHCFASMQPHSHWSSAH